MNALAAATALLVAMLSSPGAWAQTRYWDGSQTNANGVVDGGNGSWTSGGSNWTSADGLQNQVWGSNFGVFQGTAGTVTVDGIQALTGLQFLTDGYRLNAGNGGLLSIANGSNAAMRVGAGATATIGVSMSGAGALMKLDGGTLVLNGANSYTGGTTLNGGTLVVGSNTALGTGSVQVSGVSTLSSGNNGVTLNNDLGLNANLTVNGNHNLGLNGVLSGNAQLIKTGTGDLRLAGINSFAGGVALGGGSLSITNSNALGSGALTATGTSTLANTQALALSTNFNVDGDLTLNTLNTLTLGGQINGYGNLIKDGLDELVVVGANGFGGTLNVLNGSVTTLGGFALGSPTLVNVNSGATLNLNGNTTYGNLTGSGTTIIALGSTLSVGTSNVDSVYAGTMNDAGGFIKTGTGVMELTGTSVLGSGNAVNKGTLKVTGSLTGSSMTVSNGGILTGTGQIGGPVVVFNNGHLAGTSGSTLTMGALNLISTGIVDVALGSPVTGNTPLFSVGGSLTLDGTLNITDSGGFGNGVYRLFNYGGSLTNNVLTFGSLPGSVGTGQLQLQTAVANQVNLLVNSPNLNVLFWDGTSDFPDGVVNGGSGTWDGSHTNWTDLNGNLNSTWLSQFAVFQGTAGNVTVQGPQTLNGLQFMTDGYHLLTGSGGVLNALNGNSGSFAVRVDPNVTATLDVGIDGNAILNKLDTGTLVLNGSSGYTGGTVLNGGTLVVGHASALGTGSLATANGTTLDSNKALTLANNVSVSGLLNIGGSQALTLNGVVSGSGSLAKNGAGTLTLGGSNTYVGPTALNGGGLILGANTALGVGALNAADGTTLDAAAGAALSVGNALNLAGNLGIGGSADLTLGGAINGAGSLSKNGNANLTLNAANGYQGGTTLNAGTLTLGHSSALGQGTLTVATASALGSGTALSLANNIVLNANLAVGGSHGLTLGGVVSGAGGVAKNGAANLTLNGINTFQGGTTLNAGTLTLGNAAAIGTGALTVAGSSTLDSNTPLALANSLHVDADLSVAGNNNLTLSGVVAGSGSLNKSGPADLTLSGNNSFSGTFNVVSGSLSTLGGSALGQNAGVHLAAGANLNVGGSASVASLTGNGTARIGAGNTLSIGGNSLSSSFDGVLTGSGQLSKLGSGTLSLSGTSTLTGDTRVDGGTLNVGGSLASTNVLVHSGGTLTGSGSLGGAVSIADGGTLAVNTGSTLSMGGLALGSGSLLDVGLGAPAAGGGNALLNVGGNLTLDGTLNVYDVGGFGVGVYRLINYGGTLTNNGLSIGMLPSGDLQVQTAVSNQVNLMVSAADTSVQFWDGAQSAANGAIEGGSGTWDTGTSNWTTVDGGINRPTGTSFAIFQGAAGTVTVNGSQGFTGLQFVTDGYQLVNGTAGQLTAVNGSNGTTTMRVDPGVTATIAVDITGSGTLAKVDIGTLVLSGANSYTGGTALNGGKLVVGSNTALGTGLVTAAAGTTLASAGTVSLGNALNLNGLLQVSVDGSNALTLGGAINGAGGLRKDGNANLTLNAANGYQGGTTLNAGTLTVGHATALGSGALTVAGAATLDSGAALTLDSAVVLNGALHVAGSNPLTLAGQVSGSGSLIKTGSQALVLQGANTYSGGTTVNAGTLQAGSAGALAANTAYVVNGGTLDLNDHSLKTSSLQGSGGTVQLGNLASTVLELTDGRASTFAAVIAGAGALRKSGTGQWLLTGDSSGFAGSTTVQAGTLALASSGQLGGTLAVASGGTLAGTGTVGSAGTVTTVQSGGTIAPGSVTGGVDAIGTLKVAGDLRFQTGSIYQVHADPTSHVSDLIDVSGKATLAGGVLHVGPQSGFEVAKTYTVLQAGSLSGQFETVASNYAYLDPKLLYAATTVQLQLQRKSDGRLSFADLAETGNQSAVANSVESLPSSHALYRFVESLPVGAPPAIFNQLSGDSHANVVSNLPTQAVLAARVNLEQLRGNMSAGLRPGAAMAQSDGPLPASARPSSSALPAWVELVGHWQTQNGNGNAASTKQHTGGLFVGGDQELASGWRLGGSLGYTRGDGTVADRNASFTVDSYSATLYGGKSFAHGAGSLNVLGGLAYTWHDIATERKLTSLGQTLKADYSARTAQLFAEMGYALGQYGKLGVEPFVGINVGNQRANGFQETGGFAALGGQSSSDTTISSTLGVRGHSDFTLGRMDGSLRATLGWRHAFGDVQLHRTMAFEGAQNFTVAGTPLARNTALVGVEAELKLTQRAVLLLGYRGEYGSGSRDHTANIKVRWAF